MKIVLLTLVYLAVLGCKETKVRDNRSGNGLSLDLNHRCSTSSKLHANFEGPKITALGLASNVETKKKADIVKPDILLERITELEKNHPHLTFTEAEEISDGVFEYNISYKNSGKAVPFCEEEAIKFAYANPKLVKIGRIPQIKKHTKISTEIDFDINKLNAIDNSDAITVTKTEACAYIDEAQSIVPAWKANTATKKSDGSKEILVVLLDQSSNSILKEIPKSFRFDAEAKIYKNNPLDKSLTTYSLPHMQSNGYLCSNFFTTSLAAGKTPAKAADGKFHFAPGTTEFQETSVFTYASIMYDWFTNKLQINDHVAYPISLVVTDSLDSGPVYHTADPDGNHPRPTIVLPHTMGTLLHNLNYDADVPFHEVGHHFIFKYIKDAKKNKNIVLHEGGTDFFTMMLTGDPCIGETICTENSRICASNKCLRNADNNYKYYSNPPNKNPHQFSQLFSGLLWNIAEELGRISFAKTVIKGLEMMPVNSEDPYKDFLQNIVLADELLNSGANCRVIKDNIASRELSQFLDSSTCTAPKVEKG